MHSDYSLPCLRILRNKEESLTGESADGDDVMVLGGGPIGLAVVLALKSKGCKNITVAEGSGI